MNPAVAWLQRITGFLPEEQPDLTDLSEHLSVYVSSAAVALAHGRFAGGNMEASVRADPLEHHHLADLGPTLRTQVAALKLSRSPARKFVNLVLAPEMYNVSLIDRPEVDDQDLNEAVRWLIQDQVDYPMEGASLDVFELPRSASRERPMVFVVSAQTELLRNIVREIDAVGLGVASVDASELSMRNLAWKCFPQPDQSIAFLRLTSNSGFVNISRADELYLARRISGVPGHFDEAEWDGFKERMLLQVQRSIDYYESAMNQPHCNMLVVACTHSWSAQVTEHLSEMLPIPVRTVDEVLTEEMQLILHNPEAQKIDWANISADQNNALAAALPAIGGVLRNPLTKLLVEAA